MNMGIITVLLPLALAIIMIGLGLELTLNDFKRVSKHPKAVLIALFCQLVILVGVAFLLCKVLSLPALLAVGLMLLAASPGGSTANLFSYLFKGDIALNISLTAINSVVAAITLPLIMNFSILHFMQENQQITLPLSKIVQVFAIIIVPVGIGMLIRHYAPKLTEKLNKPLRIFAIVFLIAIIALAIFAERQNIATYLTQVGLATAIFCACSLAIGYFVPRLLGISSTQARACAFEIGIHNSTLAMTIALTVMANTTIAMPAAVYSIFMYIFAAAFGFMITRTKQATEQNT
ncbi:bile acid:sodium symporter family protein [Acinetobacter portensis]|uniref:Bile acid:sodium symporter family protein n=2 Tax=Acinetobacter TaxID=469 RepID=A0A6L6GD31_9GAMM|nr:MULTISPECIES: bile acid:sodium symporter family protein [Acinetobacter]MCK7608820.1 bile acid:sodium symporter family protein [Acinetobacter portensis]MCK7639588.1 bile acid:sodium symporter family protein [Acinetobacter portensis]MDY6458583.1 bile acid:sodium symporter family protein [Acinetobacter faecalis]MDY6462249.1 bile acid:sodium symporter family protein [Acinetobacter faecalis]MDY6485075.1 bile acid:sodium symporter family protein [Acinetobacter faecalis]